MSASHDQQVLATPRWAARPCPWRVAERDVVRVISGKLNDMSGLWPPLVTVAVFGLFLGGFPWLASRVRSRGVGSSVLGPFQEMWAPAHYQSHIEVQVQVERKAPAPSPGDPPWLGDQ
jgi:hypothetical protein